MKLDKLKNPWEKLTVPVGVGKYASQLVSADHPCDFYWAIDKYGKYSFRFMDVFELEKLPNYKAMSGVEVDIGNADDGRQHISLVLENYENKQLFYFLCLSLLSSTKKLDNEPAIAIATITINHLANWQSMLKNQSDNMSDNKQIGLYGELMLLNDLYFSNLKPDQAIDAWVGPEGHEQDFSFLNVLCEVKTSRASKDSRINISSIEQLDPISGDIILVHQTVSVSDENKPRSETLNGLVDKITAILEEKAPQSLDRFYMLLNKMGYEPKPVYDKKSYVIVTRKIYEVKDDFPRLVREDAKPGIEKVSYSIIIENCRNFEIDIKDGAKRILGGENYAILDPIKIPIEELIYFDENKSLEFKASLRFCFREGKNKPYIEDNIVKAVAGLSNNDGGQLIIGIQDAPREVLGLESDFLTLHNRDKFEDHLTNILINSFQETHVSKNILINFVEIDDKEICIVNIKRAVSVRYVDTRDKNGNLSKKLYTRINNSTREVPIDEVASFVDNW